MPSNYYRSRRPGLSPEVATPLAQAYSQEAQAAKQIDQQAREQDQVLQIEDDLRQRKAAEQKFNLQTAKRRGVLTQVDPATGQEDIQRDETGNPVYEAGFLGGPKVSNDGKPVVQYRDPKGRAFDVPLDGIQRTEDPTGETFYEFDLDGQRVRRPEEKANPLFKIDPATGRRFTETQDPTTGAIVAQPLGIDPKAANQAAIKRKKDEYAKLAEAKKFQADELRLQQQVFENEYKPIKEQLTEAERAAKDYADPEAETERYEQRADGLYRIEKAGRSTALPIKLDPSDPAAIASGQNWLRNKKQAEERVAQLKAEHDPRAAKLQEMQAKRDQLALEALRESNRVQTELADMEEADKLGVPLYKPEWRKKLDATRKDPRYQQIVAAGEFADSGSDLADDIQRVEAPGPDGKEKPLSVAQRILRDLNANSPRTNYVQTDAEVDPDKIADRANERSVLEVLTAGLTAGKEGVPDAKDIAQARELATKSLGVSDPEAYSLTPAQNGGFNLFRAGSDAPIGRLDPNAKQILVFPSEAVTPEGQELLTKASRDGFPVYRMGGGTPMTAQELRDYVAKGVNIARTAETPEKRDALLAQEGITPADVRERVFSGRMSVQDGKWLQEQLFGAQEVDNTPEGVKKGLAEYLAQNPAQAALMQKGKPEDKAEVINRFMDQRAAQSNDNLFLDRSEIAMRREELTAQLAGKGSLAKAGSFVKETLAPMVGIAGQAVALVPQLIAKGVGKEFESGRLADQQFMDWTKRTSSYLTRIREREGITFAVDEFRQWASRARPGEKPPEELAARIAKEVFDGYHELTPDAAKSLDTSLDTFNVNKDPMLGQLLQRYLTTANPSAFSELASMLTMDAQDRKTQAEVMKYIEAPRAASPADVLERMKPLGLDLDERKAADLLNLAKSQDAAKTPEQQTALMAKAQKLLGTTSAEDTALAMDALTKQVTDDPDSWWGVVKGGFVAGRQELATEVVTTGAEIAVSIATGGVATPTVLAERAAATAAKGGIRAAFKRMATASLNAASDYSSTFARARAAINRGRAKLGAELAREGDKFARAGMLTEKFGQPLTTAQKARNLGVATVKTAIAGAPMEAVEEGIASIGEADPTLEGTIEQMAMGAAGAGIITPIFSGMTAASNAFQNVRAGRTYEQHKAKWVEKFNERMAKTPGFKPITPADFDMWQAIQGNPTHQAAMAEYAAAVAELDALSENGMVSDAQTTLDNGTGAGVAEGGTTGTPSKANPATGSGSKRTAAGAGGPTQPAALIAAQAKVEAAAQNLAALSEVAFGVADELRAIPEAERPLYTGASKAAAGARDFTADEAKALIKQSGANAVAFQQAQALPTGVQGPQQLKTLADLPEVSTVAPSVYRLPEGVTISVPPALLDTLRQAAPSMVDLLAVNESTQAQYAPQTSTTEGDQTSQVEATPTPAQGGKAPTTGTGRVRQGDQSASGVNNTLNPQEQARLVELLDKRVKGTATPAEIKELRPLERRNNTAVNDAVNQEQAPAPKVPAKGSKQAKVANPAGLEQLARRVIAEVVAKSPTIKALVKESKKDLAYPTGGMWMNEHGTISFYMPRLLDQLQGLDETTAAKRVAALLDEEIRHAANIEASKRVFEAERNTPGNLQGVSYAVWREAWYGDIWDNHFTEEMREKVREAYGDTLPPDKWMQAMEGLRMLDQLRATGSITEAVLRHLEAVIAALREFLTNATPTVKREIANIQAVLQEYGYEAGEVRQPKAKSKPAKPRAKKEAAPVVETPAEAPPAQPNTAEVTPPQTPVTNQPFDSKKWNADREQRIKDSKAAGNEHLDQERRFVENSRGREIYNVHDPREKGVIRTVSNQGEVVVHWSDQYSADKNLANKKEEKQGKRTVEVFESWLMPSDLKDYVFQSPKPSTPTQNAPSKQVEATKGPEIVENPRYGMRNGVVNEITGKARGGFRIKGSDKVIPSDQFTKLYASKEDLPFINQIEQGDMIVFEKDGQTLGGFATGSAGYKTSFDVVGGGVSQSPTVAYVRVITEPASPGIEITEANNPRKADKAPTNLNADAFYDDADRLRRLAKESLPDQPKRAEYLRKEAVALSDYADRIQRSQWEFKPETQQPVSQEMASQTEATTPVQRTREDQQKTFAKFKRALNKAVKAKDYAEIIRQADEFQAYYENGPDPFPDSWSDWERHKADAEFQLSRQGDAPLRPLVVPVLKPVTPPRPAASENADYLKAQEDTRAALGGLFSAPARRSIPQLEVPEERFDAVRKAAKSIIDAKIRTPEAFAKFLDDTFPGGKARPYSEAIWDVMGVWDKSLRGTHDWSSIYAALDKPLPEIEEPAIDAGGDVPETVTDETQPNIRDGDSQPIIADRGGEQGGAAQPGQPESGEVVGTELPDNAPATSGGEDTTRVRQRPKRNRTPAIEDNAGRREGESREGQGGTDSVLPGTGSGVVEPSRTPARANYWLSDPESIVGGGPKARFARNRRALEVLETLQEENRDPTQEELDALAAYTGWGAFGQELFKGTYERTITAQGWEEESDWLKARLGKSDWESAQESILNAHYTDPPTVTAMWDMIRRMGFNGGRVLEPSLGTGNFFSLMPRDLMASSQLSGIELDPSTASIAKLLHPQANIRQMGYEESTTADNFYDLIVGNWPFKKGGPADRRYNHLNASLHDYFFVKAIDQVRPGGLVVGITSAGTMDKKNKAVRAYLASRGELVAAFRLPTGAFGKYAGTAVVTDIVILKKRETPLQDISGESWVESVKDDKDRDFFINAYYQTPQGRQNILGNLDFGSGSTYGRPSMIVTRSPDYEQVLPSVAQRLPEGIMQPWKPEERKVQYIANTTSFKRQNAIVVQGDELYQVNGENLGLLQDIRPWKTKDQAKRLADAKGLLGLRSLLDGLMDAYRLGEETTKQRESLLAAYNAHVKEHGPLSKSKMLDLFRRAGDPTAPDILNMEEMTPSGPRPRAILTQDIMRKRVLNAKGSIADAYALARNNSLDFRVADVAEAAGVSEAEAQAYLVEQGQIYQTPQGIWEPADVYLAGNVRQKLREAQAAQADGIEGMERNIEALQAIQPADTPYFEIEVQMGAAWIPISDYQQFIATILQADPQDVEIVKGTSGYNVRLQKSAANSALARSQWGTPLVHPSNMFTAAMNSTPLKVYSEKDKDGVRTLLVEQTEEANQKRDAIREELVTWLWSDPIRTARLVTEYNESMNAIVTPRRDGSHLRLEGLALTLGRGEFDFRQHQRDAVWRFLLDGKGVGAHEVGTGKTFTIAGLALEGRRLGVLRKPMILAHNANSSAISSDISKAYPAAKVLYLDDLGPAARENAMRQIKLDDWDAVVVPHSLVSRFALKRETMLKLVQPQLDQLENEFFAALEELPDAPDNLDFDDFENVAKQLARVKGGHTAKELMKRKKAILEDIEKRAMTSSKEDAISFEDLGIDAIIVDEAHIFKKIPLATRKNFKGLQKEMSGAGFQLQLMTDYLKSVNNGKGVFLFTGTPVTNTLNEVFNMMRFVMSDSDFSQNQIQNFDDWFNAYAQATSDIELTSGGTFEPIERVLSFINIPELARMAGRVFDVVRANDMPEFKPRDSDEGLTENPVGRPRRLTIPVIAEMSPAQREHKRNLEQRYREYQKLDGKAKMERKKKGGDVPVKIETDGRKSALDHRIYDAGADDFAGSKVNLMIRNVAEHFREHPKATQMVFQEVGVNDYVDRTKTVRGVDGAPLLDGNGKPRKTKERVATFNLLRDMVEKLVAEGVRPEEIAVFHNMSLDPITERPNDVLRKVRRVSAATPKEELAAMMNRGEIRVAFGSTQTMGTGVNAQEWLRAMHHLDAPWTPGEFEQRNGRGWRQGNRWNTVMEYRYFTEESHDGKMWQTLLNKVRFIERFTSMLQGKGAVSRVLEGEGADTSEDGSVSDFEQSFSSAAGDPRLLVRAKLEKEVQKLQRRRQVFINSIANSGKKIQELERWQERDSVTLPKLEQDHAAFLKAKEPFAISINGKDYTERKDATDALERLPRYTTRQRVGEFGPFGLYAESNFAGTKLEAVAPSGATYYFEKPSMQSLEATLGFLKKRAENMRADMAKRDQELAALRDSLSKPWSRESELVAKEKALQQIQLEITASPTPAPSWLRHGAPTGSLIYVRGENGQLEGMDVAAHRWDENDYWILVDNGTDLVPIRYSEALTETGSRLFQDYEFQAPSVSPPSQPQQGAVDVIPKDAWLNMIDEEEGRGPRSAPAPSMPRSRAEAIVRNLTPKANAGKLNPVEAKAFAEAQAVLGASDGETLASSPAPKPSPDKQAAMKDALAQMQPIARRALELSFSGRSVEEIAQEINLSVTAVGNLLRVSNGRLRFLLDKAQALKPNVRIEDGKVKATSGRPDLAGSGNAAFAAVDQRRQSPEEVTHEEMNQLASQMFAADPEAAERLVVRWMDSGTTVLSTDGMPDAIRNMVNEAQARQAAEMLMTAAAKLLVTEKALSGGDSVQTARLIDLYRSTGTEQARALGMRQDPHATPEERAAMYLSESLLTPPESLRNAIRKNPANKERILAEWARQADAIKEDLKAEGYDIDATFAEFRKEQKMAEAAIPPEVKIPLARAPGRVRKLVKAVLEGLTPREAAAKAGMTLEAARDAYNKFRGTVNDAGAQAAQQARDALLRSAPAADFAANIGLPEWTEEASPDAVLVKTSATEALKKQRTKKKAPGEIDLKNPVAVVRVQRSISQRKSSHFDKWSEFWRASILSGPQTHVVNVVSGLTYGAYEATFKKLSAATLADIARMFGFKPDAASLADLPAMFAAVMPSIKQALADSWRSLKTESGLFDAYAIQLKDGDGKAFKEQYNPALKGLLGKIMRGMSFRLMGAADEMVKSFFTRIEVVAQARQIARNENLEGESLRLRIAELMEPGSLAWIRALGQAKRITFQNEEVRSYQGSIKLSGPMVAGERSIDVIDNLAHLIARTKSGDFGGLLKGMSHFIFPFVDTPTNIFKAGVTISPVGGLLAIIDGVRSLNQMRQGNKEQANRIYNAARGLDDLTNQILVWSFIIAFSELVKPGDDEDETPYITGTLPWRTTAPGEREIAYRTAPPQSIRIGDKWFSYKRLDPFASALAFTVDAIKQMQSGKPLDEAWGQIGLGMVRNMQDKTFLQGVSDLMNAINDPERFGTRWAANIATGFVPNLVRQPIRTYDATFRDSDLPNDMPFWKALGTRVGYGVYPKAAPPAFDVWGREADKNTGTGGPKTDWLLRLFSPVDMRDAGNVDPLDVALLRYNMTAEELFGITAPSREIRRKVNGEEISVSLTDEQREEMARKAGQAARLAIGSRFNGRDLTDEDAETIKATVLQAQRLYRELAFRKATQK